MTLWFRCSWRRAFSVVSSGLPKLNSLMRTATGATWPIELLVVGNPSYCSYPAKQIAMWALLPFISFHSFKENSHIIMWRHVRHIASTLPAMFEDNGLWCDGCHQKVQAFSHVSLAMLPRLGIQWDYWKPFCKIQIWYIYILYIYYLYISKNTHIYII